MQNGFGIAETPLRCGDYRPLSGSRWMLMEVFDMVGAATHISFEHPKAPQESHSAYGECTYMKRYSRTLPIA